MAYFGQHQILCRLCRLPYRRICLPNLIFGMASSTPFSFLQSRLVAPIICTACGNNAHCFRREPDGKAELQSFRCEHCGNETTELRGEEESDYEVQKDAARIAGVANEADKALDGNRRRVAYRGWLESKFAKADGKVEAQQPSDKNASGAAANPDPN
jgi:hypothetical protein